MTMRSKHLIDDWWEAWKAEVVVNDRLRVEVEMLRGSEHRLAERVIHLEAELARIMRQFDGPLLCGFCGKEPEAHGDSDAGPMSVCPGQFDGSLCPHDPSCDHRDGCNFEGPGALWCPRHEMRHGARIDGPGAAS